MNGKYLIIAVLFALGVGLITFGVTSNAEATWWGITFHARLANGLGLITTAASILTILIMYGSSLPPNQAERRLQATLASRRGEQSEGRKQAPSGWDRRPIGEPTPDERHSAVSMGKGTTGSWMRVAAEGGNSHSPTT